MLIVNKKNLYKISYFSIPILLTIHILGSDIRYLLEKPINPYLFRNFLFLGFPFFMLGNLINKYKKSIISRISNKQIFIFILSGILISIFTRMMAKTNEIYIGKELYFGSIIIASFMLILSIKNSNRFRCTIMEKIGEKYSLFIYLSHSIIAYIVTKIANIININESTIYCYGMPILICIITTLAAWDFI